MQLRATRLTAIASAVKKLFNPISLFSAGEQGAWYDPSDMSTMFQDAAGTVPVTGMEQPVGLILDKSKGLVLGPELVTNGDFSNGTTGWTTTAGTAAVVAGKLRLTRASNGGRFGQEESTQIGKTYKVSVEYSVGTAGPCIFRVTNNADQSADTRNFFVNLVAGINTFYVQATATTTYFVIGSTSGDVGTYSDLDNISVRELPGNHATQTTTTSRPVLSARVNLLTKTEQFDDAVWIRVSGVGGTPTITQNTAIAPNGTMTADTYTQASTANTSRIYQSVNLPSGVAHKHVMHVKKNVGRWAYLAGLDGALTNGFHAWFDLDTGQVGSSSAIGAGTFVSANITSVENGFYRIEVFGSVASTSVNACWFYVADANNSTTRLPGGSAFIWGADARATNMGIDLPAYQRVNTATDYDTAGFPMYLRFDGVDDWLVTPSIDFTAINNISVFAGVRKLSDAARGIIVEQLTLGAVGVTSFGLSGPQSNGAPNYAAFVSAISLATVAAPSTNVLTGLYAPKEIVAQTALKVNGGVGIATDGSITSSVVNHPIFIGRRGGALLSFNGHLYSLIVRGAQSTEQQIASAETWVNGKTKAY